MSPAVQKIRCRMDTSLDDWNHPVRMVVSTPIFVLVGSIVSLLVQTELEHYGYTIPSGRLLTAVFLLATLSGGLAVLALVD